MIDQGPQIERVVVLVYATDGTRAAWQAEGDVEFSYGHDREEGYPHLAPGLAPRTPPARHWNRVESNRQIILIRDPDQPDLPSVTDGRP